MRSPIWSKQDIQNLKNSFVVTDDGGNQASWPIDKGAESFEIMPPAVDFNFAIESKNQ